MLHTLQNNSLYGSVLREEELKNKVAQDFFAEYDCTQIIGNIDFCVAIPHNKTVEKHLFLLWAEAKRGYQQDLSEALVQLVLTIGRSKTYERFLPPPFLGAFNAAQIAFIPYNKVLDIFALNDFNWNVTPSNHDTKEFKQLYTLIQNTLDENFTLFHFSESNTLKLFIHNNFQSEQTSVHKIQITKNNFIAVYEKWSRAVKPSIKIDWTKAKKIDILDADFYLADLLSENNLTLKEKLYVLLKKDHYEFDRKFDEMSLLNIKSAFFNDQQKVHRQFWQIYERPPKEEFWDFIIARRDQLVPQDVRERKGSFFTPRQWVELSQQYLAEVLGENWQDEYYIWDCAAGTGNLLAGLYKKHHIWASTLDQADIDIMKDRIVNGANLLESHVFKFDFLQDDFKHLPKNLQTILNDPNQRKRLLIYINPPYAESPNMKTLSKQGKNRSGVALNHGIYQQYQSKYGKALLELYAQFLCRIYEEIPGCKIANFSKLKSLQAQNFQKFRDIFQAKLLQLFLVPANTFDNVKGKFPIGFHIWDTAQKARFLEILAPIYDAQGNFVVNKIISSYYNDKYIVKWMQKYHDKKGVFIAYLRLCGTDMQHNRGVFISNRISENDREQCLFTIITPLNIIEFSIYYTVRHVIEETWYNDRDQFLYPDSAWEKDKTFQNNCLTFMLFTNVASCEYDVNHLIPFTEDEVNAQDLFDSNFMTNYLKGQYQLPENQKNNLSPVNQQEKIPNQPLEFSPEAQDVFATGKALWQYYHAQSGVNPNAGYYDIKVYFQGRNAQGKLNPTSQDQTYNQLHDNLKISLKILAEKIAPKVYEYGFLKK